MITVFKKVKAKIKKALQSVKGRKRIPIEEIYWKKGMYKELVSDPYNLA